MDQILLEAMEGLSGRAIIANSSTRAPTYRNYFNGTWHIILTVRSPQAIATI
jgi:hypothetical protein